MRDPRLLQFLLTNPIVRACLDTYPDDKEAAIQAVIHLIDENKRLLDELVMLRLTNPAPLIFKLPERPRGIPRFPRFRWPSWPSVIEKYLGRRRLR